MFPSSSQTAEEHSGSEVGAPRWLSWLNGLTQQSVSHTPEFVKLLLHVPQPPELLNDWAKQPEVNHQRSACLSVQLRSGLAAFSRTTPDDLEASFCLKATFLAETNHLMLTILKVSPFQQHPLNVSEKQKKCAKQHKQANRFLFCVFLAF